MYRKTDVDIELDEGHVSCRLLYTGQIVHIVQVCVHINSVKMCETAQKAIIKTKEGNCMYRTNLDGIHASILQLFLI